MRLAVEVEGAGQHRGAWRWRDARPRELFTAGHHVRLAQLADRGGLDLLLLADSYLPGPADRTGEVGGRLDPVAIAARLAPVTERVALVPALTASATPADPSAVCAALAALDIVSPGRVGCQLAPETVEAVARCWDRWVDGFAPRGRPLLVARAEEPVGPASGLADVVRVRAPDLEAAASIRERVRDAAAAAGRDPDDVAVLLDVEVLLTGLEQVSRTVLERLDLFADTAHRHRSLAVIGTPVGLAEVVEQAWRTAAADGVTLVPLRLPADLRAAVDEAVPLLRAAGGMT